ncbi:excalibur calcium-binding domain-containing protein [Sphingomonas sp. RB1R13]|uniref:excalibur calcium-binding domain-containing protein n=1 Tax=Sphingomonas sp. RB1R13 TaxID=3096159 RepID=UPI002FCC7681
MSFRKPFRAQPVKLGPYALAGEEQKRRSIRNKTVGLIAGLAMAVFVAGLAITNWNSIRRLLPTYYPSCSWAQMNGAKSIKRGEPGYRDGLDADQDGLACEPLPKYRLR